MTRHRKKKTSSWNADAWATFLGRSNGAGKTTYCVNSMTKNRKRRFGRLRRKTFSYGGGRKESLALTPNRKGYSEESEPQPRTLPISFEGKISEVAFPDAKYEAEWKRWWKRHITRYYIQK